MSEMKNVHTYDGLLKDLYTATKDYSDDEKRVLYNSFKESIDDPYAKDMIRTMLSDSLKGDKIDNTNNIDWSNLFADILSHKELKEVKDMLEEQLKDMRVLGPCAQGRSTRLLQIWNAINS